MDGEAILAIVFFGGILLLALCGALSALFARIFIEPRQKKKELLEKEIQAQQIKNQETIKKAIEEGCAKEREKLESERAQLEKQKIEYQEKKDKLDLEYDNKLEALREKYKSERDELRKKIKLREEELQREYDEKEKGLTRKEHELNQRIADFSKQNEENIVLKTKNAELERALEFEKEKIRDEILEWYEREFIRLFGQKFNTKGYFDNIGTGRFSRAMTSIEGMKELEITAKFSPQSDKRRKTDYTTTLYSCDCGDSFKKSHVCKHRMYLAYYLGFMQFYANEFERTYDKLVEAVVSIDEEFDKSKKSKTKRNASQ